MSERYRVIATMRQQGHTYSAIAEHLNLTPYRVRQLYRDIEGWQRVANRPLPTSDTPDYTPTTTAEADLAQD